MTTAAPLKVACLGAGYFSQFHCGSWVRLNRVQLVGSCDLDNGKARATGLPAYEDLAQMLSETRPDILDIILPPVAHAKSIQVALSAGVKTLICQEPFCEDLAEASAVADLVAAAGARIIVNENFRFQPWYRAIKRAIEAGAVGNLLQATFRLRPGDGQGPRAYLDRQPYFQKMERFLIHETAVHWIDTFRYLLGDPTSVYADLRRINPAIAGEDAGHVLFDHPGGITALFDGNRHLDHNADNLRRTMGEAVFEGTDATLTLLGNGSVQRRAFGSAEAEILLPPDNWTGFGGDCIHALQGHVVSGILDGTLFENEAPDYLQVIRIEEAIYLSAANCRKVRL